MNYLLRTPCDACPFLNGMSFTLTRLREFASGEFPCHKTARLDENIGYVSKGDKSQHCAGALIFLEKQNAPHQMMRIMERMGYYDRSKLDMDAPVVNARRRKA
jgi:hypothetical protein